ncbi:MAG: hypothetical protein ACOYYS_17815 [Chloroflexota bacterium]
MTHDTDAPQRHSEGGSVHPGGVDIGWRGTEGGDGRACGSTHTLMVTTGLRLPALVGCSGHIQGFISKKYA